MILDPPLLASYYGHNLLERRPVTLDEVSPDLIASILAAEDETFFGHAGVSLTGTARAVWVDLRGKGVRQGGSTLTQQLVKNLYLTQERTLTRKSQEILLAVLLEMRYPKKKILEAYLNEIYLGGGNGVSLIGVGAASRAYFGKDADQLDLAEAATLAGIIPSPANYSPITHPDRAKLRRDWVLGRLAKLGLVPQARDRPGAPASRSPWRPSRWCAGAPPTSPTRRPSRRRGASASRIWRTAATCLFSTLDWAGQKAAQEAVESGLKADRRRAQEAVAAGGADLDGPRAPAASSPTSAAGATTPASSTAPAGRSASRGAPSSRSSTPPPSRPARPPPPRSWRTSR